VINKRLKKFYKKSRICFLASWVGIILVIVGLWSITPSKPAYWLIGLGVGLILLFDYIQIVEAIDLAKFLIEELETNIELEEVEV